MKRSILGLAGALALVAAPVFGMTAAHAAEAAPVAVRFITEQPTNEWLARVFLGQPVHNTAGEVVGDVNDLIFDHQGRISAVVIGVGGFLSMGEKNVAVSYSDLTFNVGPKGERVIVVAVTKEILVKAPAFVATEKTTFDKVKDEAAILGQQTSDKAGELKDKAVQKYEDMTKPAPAK